MSAEREALERIQGLIRDLMATDEEMLRGLTGESLQAARERMREALEALDEVIAARLTEKTCGGDNQCTNPRCPRHGDDWTDNPAVIQLPDEQPRPRRWITADSGPDYLVDDEDEGR